MIQTTRESSPRGDELSSARSDPGRDYYIYQCESGHRFLIYRPAALGYPSDHDPGKWYYLRIPVPIGIQAGDGFDGPELAELAARRQADLMS